MRILKLIFVAVVLTGGIIAASAVANHAASKKDPYIWGNPAAAAATDPGTPADQIQTPPPPASTSNGFAGDGTFLVGSDIQPGLYKAAPSPTGNCYWEREADLNGGVNSIIDNDNTSGPAVIKVAPSDKAVTVNGCADFHKAG